MIGFFDHWAMPAAVKIADIEALLVHIAAIASEAKLVDRRARKAKT